MSKRKRAPQKRLRRAWAKPFSMRMMRGPNFELMSEFTASARGINAAEQLFPAPPNLGHAGRKEAIKRREELLNSVEPHMNIRMKGNQHYPESETVRLFIDSKRHVVFFIRQTEKLLLKSIEYGKKEMALYQYAIGRVAWLEVIEEPPPAITPPELAPG